MLRKFASLLASISFMALAACGSGGVESETQASPGAAPIEASDANTQFDAAADVLASGFFDAFPEIATYYGAPEELASNALSRLSERSPAAERRNRARMEALLSDLKGLDSTNFDQMRQVAHASIIAILEGALAPARVVDYGAAFGEYGVWFLPYVINHNSGVLVSVPSLLDAQHTVSSAREADAYLARLGAFAAVIDGALEKMRKDASAGVVPPDFMIERTIEFIDGFLSPGPEGNLLYAGFDQKLNEAGIEDSQVYKARALEKIANEIFPAYQRVRAYLEELLPAASHEAGVWRLPKGEAFYRAMIRHMTDTDLAPEVIHQIGLEEVSRIEAEMDSILRSEGYAEGTVGERMARLAAEERFLYPNTAEGRAAILAGIKGQLDAVNAVLPQWFGKLPKYDVEVRAVPAFSEATAAGGYYDAPALDGSRPGIYWINLRDTALWPKFSVPTLTYHEAVPGHHMQTAVALDQGAPLIANILFSNASGEGWGLYAERLASEMGLYADDPYGDLGRLRDEMHRAIRLVVDTGMHAKKWSREEAIEYMHAHEGGDISDETSEIERYAAWPGQALGYKIGMLKILELRSKAQAALGAEFDIRAFHDEVLRVSSAALPVIEAHMLAWIEEQSEEAR